MPEKPNYDPKVREDFYAMYVASRRAAIRALFNKPGEPTMDLLVRQSRCVALAKQGYVVDPQIDTGLFDPYTINAQAIQGGYKTRPKIGETVPFCTPPGVSAPNIPNYNDFTFAITSTIAPADYPKSDEPDVPVVEYVGQRANQEGMYNSINNAQDVFQIGDKHFEQKHNWTFGPFAGGIYYWTLDSE
jgi:hypothetical protein